MLKLLVGEIYFDDHRIKHCWRGVAMHPKVWIRAALMI